MTRRRDPRFRTRPTNDGLEIVIPAKLHVVHVLFLTTWLVGWAMGETFAIGQFHEDTRPGASLFVLAWLAMWTIGGGWATYTGLRFMFGHELITLTPDTLAVKHDLWGLGRKREYDLAHVTNLRIGGDTSDPSDENADIQLRGTIAFDYRGRTFRFGAFVEEAEAAEIVAELESRHSFACENPGQR